MSRRGAAVVLCVVTVPVLAGCTGGRGAGEAAGIRSTGSSTSPRPSTAPSPAGAALAAAAARLPEGPASGQVTITWSGLGELTGPFAGTCSRAGEVSTVSGRTDTATIAVRFAPDGSSLAVDDQGTRSTGRLAEGDYQVQDGTLTAGADLLGGGGAVGTLTAEITCG